MKTSIIALSLVAIFSATSANARYEHDMAQVAKIEAQAAQQNKQVKSSYEKALHAEGLEVAKLSSTSGEFDAYYKVPVEGACGEGICIKK